MRKTNNNKMNSTPNPKLYKSWNNCLYQDSFSVISAFKFNKHDNHKQHTKLKKTLRALKMSHEELIAGNVESGKKTVIKSLFIADINRNDAVNLAFHFNQKCILFKDDKGLSEISLHEKSGYSRMVKSFIVADDNMNPELNLEVLRYYSFAKLFQKHDFAFLHNVVL